MAGLYQLRSQLLDDRRITDKEVDLIRRHIASDGQLDLEDIKLLVELRSDADEICSAFDTLFFPAFKSVLLDDGRITQDEHFYLLKMLYSNGCIRDVEKQFLIQLRQELKHVSPEFESLCQVAFAAHPTHWDVGGHAACQGT